MTIFLPDTKEDFLAPAAAVPGSSPQQRTRSARRRLAYLAVLVWVAHAAFSLANTAVNHDDTSLHAQAANGLHSAVDWVKWHCKPLPTDPRERALAILSRYPIVDGHIDLPIQVRERMGNQISEIDVSKPFVGHVDIPRLREGKVGGFFWSVYTPCPGDLGQKEDPVNFTIPFNAARDTLEQIDIARLIIQKHSDTFELTPTVSAWRHAIRRGKIGGMLGVEGGHQLGNSLATIRTYFDLGVRYVTFTHSCHNALADSCTPTEPRWNGLSSFGKAAVREMNRLGMIIDISHTSSKTASDILSLSLAPPIWSHSDARGIHDVTRNIPDSTLRRIGNMDGLHKDAQSLMDNGEDNGWGSDTGEATRAVPAGDAIIMLNFLPGFVSEGGETGQRANISLVADHADRIGRLAGRRHVGIGSDFDGINSTPVGLEDVSKYPDLIAELIKRGWSDKEIAGIASENLFRVLSKVEEVAHALRDQPPHTDIFEGRTDIGPRHKSPW